MCLFRGLCRASSGRSCHSRSSQRYTDADLCAVVHVHAEIPPVLPVGPLQARLLLSKNACTVIVHLASHAKLLRGSSYSMTASKTGLMKSLGSHGTANVIRAKLVLALLHLPVSFISLHIL